jgi:hypothetical protein
MPKAEEATLTEALIAQRIVMKMLRQLSGFSKRVEINIQPGAEEEWIGSSIPKSFPREWN